MTVPYIFANISGQIPLSELDANFAAVSAYSNTAGTVTASAQPNIASVGILTTLTVSGNVTADYFIGNTIGSISNAVYANTAGFASSANIANVANIAYSVSGANITGAVANATYAVTANSANYANLAITATVANTANSVAGANITGAVANATYAVTANVASYAGTVTANAQPNITSVGNLTSLTVSGNSTVINNSTVGANIIVSGYANIGSYISAVGNVTGNNFSALGAISTNSYLSATGNITGGNLGVGAGNVGAGNVVFASNGSKFNSASWTLVESFTNLNNYYSSGNSSVTMNHTFNYYATNYNEFMIKLSPVPGYSVWNITTFYTTIALNSVSSGDIITIGTTWNHSPGATDIDFSYVTWANVNSTGLLIHNLYTGVGDYPSTNLYIYAR